MRETHPNEKVEIVVLPNEAKKKLSATDRRKIERLIRNKLLLRSKEVYCKVQVELTRRPDGTPESLLASMLRAYTYTADIMKVNVDADYKVISVESLSGGP